MAKTGVVRDEYYIKHSMGAYHVENPQRLEVIYQMIDSEGFSRTLTPVYPREATRAEITAVHAPEYYQTISATAQRPGMTFLDPDTSTCPETFRAAMLAAGGLLALVDVVQDRILDNGFALVRPPGHHAEADRAMGFCIFNNVAIAARYLMKEYGLKRILIVDWDLHHGNGTQHHFYDDPQVLYFSTHQYPFYPGTGAIQEVGRGAGAGYTVNVPLPGGAGDFEYMSIFRDLLQPLAREFAPEFLLVSAGFDIYFQDPLGGMQVTPEGFGRLARVLLDTANEVCGGRLALVLEGGYSLEGLRDSVRSVLLELSGKSSISDHSPTPDPSYDLDAIIQKVKAVQGLHWRCFAH
ncbi:MAG TPA: histone deacetylase [Thermodesulfobacteriota bacterium]|nr:histone deacetylase [Thermodesulfobacteriota bacterium]